MRPVFFDVELSRNGAVCALAALGPGGAEVVAARAADVPRALAEIARWDVDLLVGHNLHAHDRPWLARYAPGHALLALPFVDTLVLSPLAFPERPYHRLIKEERLVRDSLPAPLSDCRATRVLLADALSSLARTPRPLLDFVRAALADPRVPGANVGYERVLAGLGGSNGARTGEAPAVVADGGRGVSPAPPSLTAALPPLRDHLRGLACDAALATLTPDPALALPLAYVAAWVGVPPGSTLPAWVRMRHPEVRALLTSLRGWSCGGCAWCDAHTPEGWLKRMFGYDAFRPVPAAPDGGSLQRAIVAAGLEDRPLYAVLPTGTGKSLCFQIPAAARHQRTGALTVVISPLQSLMKDQVDQLRDRRDPHATTINGSLTMPERTRALEEVRDGNASIVYVSPEQLRNRGVRSALASRSIGAWVIDEAHCLTDWGHDFRTDYLYVPRFARELASGQGVPVPPFQCFTGTSQVAVTAAIRELLQQEVGQDLTVFDGGAERTNLTFIVEAAPKPQKPGRMLELLATHLADGGAGIVFCATRGETEDVAKRLVHEGWDAAAYHAGLDAQKRREVQDRFLGGALRVIAATSAFGMGVDKPDVRLVIHLEVPGSLEAYLQQAGRAGRDGDPATCVLLFQPEDVDAQFRLTTMSTLSLRDLQALWRGLQRVPARRSPELEERVVTRGELARLDVVSSSFDPHDPVTDTRLAAAVAWLERAGLFARDENQTHLFQGRPRHPTLAAAKSRIDELKLPPHKAEAWLRVLARLYDAPPDEGLTADDLAELAGDDQPIGAGVRTLDLLRRMTEAGLLTGGVQLSAFLAWGVADASGERAERLLADQAALLDALPELSHGADTDQWLRCWPQLLADRMRLEHEREVDAARVRLLLRALERDGQGLSDQPRSADIRQFADRMHIRMRRSWAEVARLGKLRAAAARAIVRALEPLAAASGERGKAILVGFDLDLLVRAIEGTLLLTGQVRDAPALIDQVLLLLHDARVLVLQGGLSVFRQAMVLRRKPDAPRAVRRDAVEPLFRHQEERTLQIHIVGEYARLGADGIERAQALTRDWFTVPRDVFLKRWFPGRLEALRRATSPESYRKIVDDLDARQREVVTFRPDANLLVLAGPGSGKTRVLVHRVAWLVRVKRVRPEGVLVVCYTRANAIELRRRLRGLIDADARGVTVSTLHGLALRLTGRAPQERAAREEGAFDQLLEDAVAVLRGQRVTDGADADEARDLVLRGATHLLVDEYQDLDERQVRLLEAIAGRAHPDESQRLAMFAVGDDDQSIFGFRGGSARWVREFATAWQAEQRSLTMCYRCPRPVLDVAARIIAPVEGRLKADATLESRKDGAPVRRWVVPPDTLGATVARLVEEAARGADGSGLGDVTDLAILARTRGALAPVRAALEMAGWSVEWPLPSGDALPLARVREVVRVRDFLDAHTGEFLDAATLDGLVDVGEGPWRALLRRWRDDLASSHGDHGVPGGVAARALWELLATERGERTLGHGVRLGTVHGAKGLEWSRVILVDDGEGGASDDDRRLWYVALTRAGVRLDLVLRSDRPGGLLAGLGVGQVPPPSPTAPRRAFRYELLGLGDLWIDALGRDVDPPGLRVLDALPYGATVTMEQRGARVALVANGAVIGLLTRAAADTWLPRRATLTFVAAIQRTADQSEPPYQERLRRDAWWVPVCEGRWEG